MTKSAHGHLAASSIIIGIAGFAILVTFYPAIAAGLVGIAGTVGLYILIYGLIQMER